MIARDALPQSRFFIQHGHRADFGSRMLNAHDSMASMNSSPACGDSQCDFLPHLTWAKFRIEKSLDEAGLGLLLRRIVWIAKGAAYRMSNRLRDRQPLDALRTPFCGDVRAGHPPDFLRVVSEERLIQTIAKAVDEEIFQRRLRHPGHELRPTVAQPDPQSFYGAQILQGTGIEGQRIVEKAPAIKNPRQPLPNQHDGVGA